MAMKSCSGRAIVGTGNVARLCCSPLWVRPATILVCLATKPIGFPNMGLLGIICLYADYDAKVCAELKKNGVDASVDNRSEKIGYKIREARLDKLPYWVVVGEKEEADGNVAVSSRYAGNEGVKSLGDFVAQITEEIRTKAIRKVEVVEDATK